MKLCVCFNLKSELVNWRNLANDMRLTGGVDFGLHFALGLVHRASEIEEGRR